MATAVQNTAPAPAAATTQPAATGRGAAAGFGGDFNTFLKGLMHAASNAGKPMCAGAQRAKRLRDTVRVYPRPA